MNEMDSPNGNATADEALTADSMPESFVISEDIPSPEPKTQAPLTPPRDQSLDSDSPNPAIHNPQHPLNPVLTEDPVTTPLPDGTPMPRHGYPETAASQPDPNANRNRPEPHPVQHLPIPSKQEAEKRNRQDELPLQQPQEVITLQLPDRPFAKIIQQFRLDANVPIKEVSDKTKISATFINDLEQARFQALPSLDFCLAKIEQLCLEYDVDSKLLIEKFCVEYQTHKQKEEPKGYNNRMHGRHAPGTFIQTTPTRLPGLPAIFIGVVLLLLIGLLAYAFHAHQTHQMPDRLDADLTEHIPIHQPEIILLDEVRR